MSNTKIAKAFGDWYEEEKKVLKQMATSNLTSDHDYIAQDSKVSTLLRASLMAYELEGRKSPLRKG